MISSLLAAAAAPLTLEAGSLVAQPAATHPAVAVTLLLGVTLAAAVAMRSRLG